MKLEMGVSCPAISIQLRQQGINADKNCLKKWEKCVFSLNFLRIQGILTSKDFDKAAMRLLMNIGREVNAQNRAGGDGG